jgi:hypothetical protein
VYQGRSKTLTRVGEFAAKIIDKRGAVLVEAKDDPSFLLPSSIVPVQRGKAVLISAEAAHK